MLGAQPISTRRRKNAQKNIDSSRQHDDRDHHHVEHDNNRYKFSIVEDLPNEPGILYGLTIGVERRAASSELRDESCAISKTIQQADVGPET